MEVNTRKILAPLTIGATMLGFLITAMPASADINPPGCLNNDFVVNLQKSVNVAYDQTNPNGATTITYSVDAGNPQDISGKGCNVDNVNISVTDPHGVVHVIQTGGSYPIGTADAVLGTTVSYVANSADEVSNDLVASVSATGSLHDKVNGTDPLNVGKTVSVTVIHPNTTVTVTPSAASVAAGGTVTLTVTEHNTGDDPITSPSVTLTPPGTTLVKSSPTFTSGDTGNDGILGVGETWTWTVTGVVVNSTTTYTAVGDGLDSLGHHVTYPAYSNERAQTTVTVLINHPTIATTLSATSGNVGVIVHDSSTLTGATATAGGTVTYTVYTNNTCNAGAMAAGTVTVTNGIVPNSNPITFNTAGTYYWQASYSGDANNASAVSPCQSEVLVVTQPVGQYCSPGYWKQPQHFDSYVTYNPNQTFASVFGRTITIDWSSKGKPAPLTNPTLLQALEAKGGGINMLARVAVDGLLNSTALFSGHTPAQVIAIVQTAIDTGNYDLAASQLSAPENCPLN